MTTQSIFPHESVTSDAGGETRAAGAAEADLLDHEYDGIREYDNPLPAWWVMIFWATFVFSLGYFFHYHLSGNGKSVEATYRDDIDRARHAQSRQALAAPPTEEAIAALMKDPKLMLEAGSAFKLRCAPCHAAEGQGLIGPNLTDDHWIHGQGGLMDIYGVVSHGIAAKGMPAWELQLPPPELRKLVAFVGTLRGKNLPGKPAEGSPVGKP